VTKKNFLFLWVVTSILSEVLVKKNNNKFNARWSFLFNAVIDGLDPRELEMSGRKYTWANSLKNPTFEILDRVLVSTE